MRNSAAKTLGCIAAFCVLLCATGAVLFPFFARAKSHRVRSPLTNMKQVGLSMSMYLSDHDETFPPADTWADATYPYVKNRLVYGFATSGGPTLSAAINALLDRKSLHTSTLTADKLVSMFQVEGEVWNAWGGPANVYWWPGDSPRTIIGFADSHVAFKKRPDFALLRWRP